MLYFLESKGRLKKEKEYMQHGSTSVYEHSVKVAYISLCLAKWLHLKVDPVSLMRGALLHDYFLYDWHEKDRSHRLHGFRHASTALRNAERDFQLNEVEKNIIARHMFPLNPIPPKYKEAWVVCLADKYCAFLETVRLAEKINV
ncbi:MAG: HD domain-containing protein [Eubacterium sp.]|nr:HD domain-containing protein [Eubacterium sp.]